MAPAESPIKHFYEFGPFRLAPTEHRLYRNGDAVQLPPKEFDLLLLLVQNSGKVMGRDILLKALWPNTIVEEANLNVHISALRKVLAESSGELQFIETLPRLGYRFIVPVTEVAEPEKTADASPLLNSKLQEPHALENGERSLVSNMVPIIAGPEAPKMDWVSRHRLAAVTLPLWLLAIGLLGVLAILFFKPFRQTSGENGEAAPFNVVPLTTYPGRELQPAFSPDGNHVAFVWGGEKGDNTDIYVRLVDGGNWVRLTSQPGDDVNPVWSPDGRTIAFYRSASDGDGVFLMTSLGGDERKLVSTWANRFGFGSHTWLSWSPDGKWLVISDKTSTDEPFSLYLLSPQTGEKRRLTMPPAAVIGDCSPAFSPDGQQLAFVRVISAVVGEVFLVSMNGGEPKRLTFDGAGISNLTWGPAWGQDGRGIIFSSRFAGKSRLLQISSAGGTSQWLAASGNDVQYPAFSRQGNRLAWMQNTDNIDILRIPLKNNSETANGLPRLITSTANEVSPRYSPDGKRIVFVSTRSGTDEIWVCGSEGENPIRLTSFRGPLAGSPNWSPDGKQIVFDCRPEGNADIFIVSSDGGQPRRLTTDSAEDIVPSWSRDGRWIYFTSNRSGRLQIWKAGPGGGDAIQVTQQGGFEPMESPDGQWIYYTQDRGTSNIWRVPVAGGEESPVFDFHQKSYSRMWTVETDGIYFAAAESPSPGARASLKFFSFSTETEKTLAEIDGNLPISVSGLSLSPDGKWLLLPQIVQRGSDLMMIENFR